MIIHLDSPHREDDPIWQAIKEAIPRGTVRGQTVELTPDDAARILALHHELTALRSQPRCPSCGD